MGRQLGAVCALHLRMRGFGAWWGRAGFTTCTSCPQVGQRPSTTPARGGALLAWMMQPTWTTRGMPSTSWVLSWWGTGGGHRGAGPHHPTALTPLLVGALGMDTLVLGSPDTCWLFPSPQPVGCGDPPSAGGSPSRPRCARRCPRGRPAGALLRPRCHPASGRHRGQREGPPRGRVLRGGGRELAVPGRIGTRIPAVLVTLLSLCSPLMRP